MIITYQDFMANEQNRAKWLGHAIARYMRSDEYKTAQEADLYEKQQNVTINQYIRMVYDITGVASPDFASPNNRIASNFFHRLNTQRCTYSLGNGISFASRVEKRGADMKLTITDKTKDELGEKFDRTVFNVAYYALIHGRCYCFDNDGEYYIFPMTEFLPFPDEISGKIRAGVRFWSVDWGKSPVIADLYEEDGYSRYRTAPNKYGLGALQLEQKKRPYRETVQYSEADGEQVIGGNNYTSLPVAVMYGNKAKQSNLVGMKASIDAYDMIQSGFANDLSECAQMYWIIDNAAGMNDDDIRRLRDRMLLQHIVVADEMNSKITPYAKDVPYNSREACLDRLRRSIYQDFGGLNVNDVSAGQNLTATEIRAAYQTVDEEADDFEYQVSDFIQQILRLHGLEDAPVFHRNRIGNQMEDTQMVMLAADYLDDETILRKLPFITIDEIDSILARRDGELGQRIKVEE